MDRSLVFYRDLLGLRVILDSEMQGEMLEREVALEGAHLRIVVLGFGEESCSLELLQYLAPIPAPDAPTLRPSDVGAHHVALLVDDIGASYAALIARGVQFTCPPQEVDEGFFRGHWTAYCFDPDGLIVELWQLPR